MTHFIGWGILGGIVLSFILIPIIMAISDGFITWKDIFISLGIILGAIGLFLLAIAMISS